MSQSVTKQGFVVQVSEEMLREPTFTVGDLIAANERARLARLRRWEDEVLYGADLNPCIVLGEN